MAWVVPDGGAQTFEVRSTSDPDQQTSWTLPGSPVGGPVGILGQDFVVYKTMSANGKKLLRVAHPDGTTTDLPYVRAFDAEPMLGLISVQTQIHKAVAALGSLMRPPSRSRGRHSTTSSARSVLEATS